MLGYYVDWHMREALAPMLFAEEDREAAAAKRKNIVAPAERSDTTLSKVSSKVDEEGRPVHSLRTLLGNLSSIVSSTFRPKLEGAPTFEKLTQPTADQARAFEAVGSALAGLGRSWGGGLLVCCRLGRLCPVACKMNHL